MKLETPANKVAAGNVLRSWDLSIQTGPHMIEMLIRMYKDPIGAPVREILANVSDAYSYLAAGAAIRAPEIHVPTALEPYLEIKDFGIGMDLDTIENVFSVHGASTKRETNTAGGGFGIGGKSIYAYKNGDQFVITGVKNGRKAVVIAHRNEEGVPVFSLVEDAETDEPSGVTVRISVHDDDVEKFRTAVAKYLKYFGRVAPAKQTLVPVVSDPSLDVAQISYTIMGKDWGIHSNPQHPWQAVIAGVPYPITVDEMDSVLADTSTNYAYRDATKMSMDFYLPVGSVDIPPARDGLEFTDKTKKVIREAFAEALKEIAAKTSDLIARQPNEFEAVKALKQAWGVPALHKYLTGVKYNGNPISTLGVTRDAMALYAKAGPGFSIERFYNDYGKASITRVTSFGKGDKDAKIVVPVDENDSKLWLIVDDLDNQPGHVTRIRLFMRDKLMSKNSWSRRYSARAQGNVFYFTGISADKLSKLFGGAPVMPLSSLPMPTRAANNVFRPTQVKVWRSYEFVNVDDAGIDISDDTEEFFYVALYKNEVQGISGSMDALILNLKKLDLMEKDQHLFGIPRTKKAIENYDNWFEIKEALTKDVEKLVKKYAQRRADYLEWKDIAPDIAQFFTKLSLHKIPKDDILKEIAKEIRDIKADAEVLGALIYVASAFGIEWPKKNPRKERKTLMAKAYKKYPLFKILAVAAGERYGRQITISDKIDVIADYVNLVTRAADTAVTTP